MHCTTGRKVAGSVPYQVIGFLNLPNPSSCTMALGSTQPLTEMSTRNLTGGKGRPTSRPSVKGQSRSCGSLDVSLTYGPPRPITKMALRFNYCGLCEA
jgi:hypothetical protein